jgi:beta-lactamase class A
MPTSRMLDRRHFLTASSMALCSTALPRAAFAATPLPSVLQAELQRLEKASGGRLGVGIIANDKHMGYRAEERFPMCSTFKLLLAAAVLERVDRGQERLDRKVVYTQAQVLEYAPITSKHVGPPGISIGELCEAAVTLSDNTAANLLLEVIGGPPAYTAFASTLGDPMTRLDRNEPTLNESLPGDPRDTTTPAFMAVDMQRVILGNVLSAVSRKHLTDWMLACKTGLAKIRAGVPSSDKIGDKTGSSNGSSNDIAVIWPPFGKPWLLTIYLTGTTSSADEQNAIIAAAARAVAAVVQT